MKPEPIVNLRRKVRRNESCPFCRSGRKFKLCCGAPQTVDTGGLMLAARAAGRPHERPVLFAFDKRVSIGPVPS